MELPEGWKLVKLGDIAEVRRGASPRPKGDPLYFSKERTPYHWIKISDIKKYTKEYYLIDTDEFLTEEGMKKSLYLQKGTLILSNSATVGVPIILDINGCIHDGYLAFLNLNENIVSKKYLYYFFLSYKNELKNKAFGGIQLNLNTKIAKNLLIPILYKDGKPDLQKQKEIVNKIETLFNNIDKAIELRQKTINETKDLFNSVLNNIFKDEGFELIKLGDIAEKIKAGGTPLRKNKKYWENGTIPWIKIQDINDNTIYINSSSEYITEEGLKNSSATLFKKGTVLYSIFASIGKVGILNIDATTNQAIVGIIPKEDIYNKYLTYVLKFESKKLTGRGNAQKNINQNILKNLLIPIPYKDGKPDLQKQKEIAEYLENLHNKIKRLENLQEKQLNLFKELKESILNKAFKGELV